MILMRGYSRKNLKETARYFILVTLVSVLFQLLLNHSTAQAYQIIGHRANRRLDINRAVLHDFESLPEIDRWYAEKIIQTRDDKQGYSSIFDLRSILPLDIFTRIVPLITVNSVYQPTKQQFQGAIEGYLGDSEFASGDFTIGNIFRLRLEIGREPGELNSDEIELFEFFLEKNFFDHSHYSKNIKLIGFPESRVLSPAESLEPQLDNLKQQLSASAGGRYLMGQSKLPKHLNFHSNLETYEQYLYQQTAPPKPKQLGREPESGYAFQNPVSYKTWEENMLNAEKERLKIHQQTIRQNNLQQLSIPDASGNNSTEIINKSTEPVKTMSLKLGSVGISDSNNRIIAYDPSNYNGLKLQKIFKDWQITGLVARSRSDTVEVMSAAKIDFRPHENLWLGLDNHYHDYRDSGYNYNQFSLFGVGRTENSHINTTYSEAFGLARQFTAQFRTELSNYLFTFEIDSYRDDLSRPDKLKPFFSEDYLTGHITGGYTISPVLEFLINYQQKNYNDNSNQNWNQTSYSLISHPSNRSSLIVNYLTEEQRNGRVDDRFLFSLFFDYPGFFMLRGDLQFADQDVSTGGGKTAHSTLELGREIGSNSQLNLRWDIFHNEDLKFTDNEYQNEFSVRYTMWF